MYKITDSWGSTQSCVLLSLNVGPTVDLEYFDTIIEGMFLCTLGIPEQIPLVVQCVNPRYFLNRLGCYSARRWLAHI